MLTFKDLNEIEKIIAENLENRLKNIPTKDEFFGSMDKLRGELQAIRNNNQILNERTSHHSDLLENHEKRISKIEQSQPLVV